MYPCGSGKGVEVLVGVDEGVRGGPLKRDGLLSQQFVQIGH